MPGWHEATKALRESGELATVGIVQEQHPDRARLFMQWQRMDWPILVDPLNLLAVSVVPITALVDEHGIVRVLGPRDPAVVNDFLAASYEPPPDLPTPTPPRAPDLAGLAERRDGGAAAERAYGQALLLWGGEDRLDDAVAAFARAAELEPDDGPGQFQLGVAHRARYDSPRRREDDFQRAADHWTRALALDPNQYIWRRRIQQYGPRLAKPYPFYNWIDEARRAIAARGETPIPLAVEPSETERLDPRATVAAADGAVPPADPEGRILRDDGRFIRLETAVVPAAVAPGDVARAHLVFRPNEAIKAHWNNEAEGMSLWLEPPPGWHADRPAQHVPGPPQAVSREVRHLELELKSPEDAAPGKVRVPGYALYYVCEDVGGTCLYRRQDLELEVAIRSR
ncbi:MAG: hypothetical protein D6696_02170 [Acidobacteria bacterium]|nr:MAG: hypothetical protein D6696_02170 [Acidobacteriota bacterium]